MLFSRQINLPLARQNLGSHSCTAFHVYVCLHERRINRRKAGIFIIEKQIERTIIRRGEKNNTNLSMKRGTNRRLTSGSTDWNWVDEMDYSISFGQQETILWLFLNLDLWIHWRRFVYWNQFMSKRYSRITLILLQKSLE